MLCERSRKSKVKDLMMAFLLEESQGGGSHRHIVGARKNHVYAVPACPFASFVAIV